MSDKKKTDRELLELAAKAAGKDIDPIRYDEDDGFAIRHMAKWWNPLRSDGDALRLAVKLDLVLMPYPADKAVRVTRLDQRDTIVSWGTPVDSCAATRRCIVRAAAAIGEGL